VNTDSVPAWLAANKRYVDTSLALVLGVLAQFQVPDGTPLWVRLSLLLATGGVAWRSASPLLAAAMVSVGVGLMAFSPAPPSVFGEYLAVLVMAYSVAEGPLMTRIPRSSAAWVGSRAT
jgi:hypothetical protein